MMCDNNYQNLLNKKRNLEFDIKKIQKIIISTRTGRYVYDDGSYLMLNSYLSDISLRYLHSELKKIKYNKTKELQKINIQIQNGEFAQ